MLQLTSTYVSARRNVKSRVLSPQVSLTTASSSENQSALNVSVPDIEMKDVQDTNESILIGSYVSIKHGLLFIPGCIVSTDATD